MLTKVVSRLQENLITTSQRIEQMEKYLTSQHVVNNMSNRSLIEDKKTALRDEFNSLANHIKNLVESYQKIIKGDNIVATLEAIEARLINLEQKNTFSNVVENAESANMQIKDQLHSMRKRIDSIALQEREAVHDVVNLANIIENVIQELKNKHTSQSLNKTNDSNLNHDFSNPQNVIGHQKDKDLIARIEHLESHCINSDQENKKFETSKNNQNNAVLKVDELSRLVTEMNNELQNLKKRLPSTTESDHTNLNYPSLKDNTAITDLVSLTNVVNVLSKDMNNLKKTTETVKTLTNLVNELQHDVQTMKSSYINKYPSDHEKLKRTLVKENIAIHDLASLTNFVFHLSNELQMMQQQQSQQQQQQSQQTQKTLLSDEFDLRNKVSSLIYDFNALKEKIPFIKLKSETVEADHARLNETFRKEIIAINDLASLTNIVAKLSRDLQDLRKKYLINLNIDMSPKNEIEGIKNELQEMRNKFNQFKYESDIVEADHAKLNYTSRKEIEAIKDLASLTNFVAVLSRDFQELKQKPSMNTNIDTSVKNNVDSLKNDIQEIQRTLSFLKPGQITSDSKLEDQSLNDKAIKDLTSLTNKVASLSNDLENFKDESFRCSKNLTFVQDSQTELKNSLSYLTDTLSDVRRETQNLKESILSLKTNANTFESDHRKLNFASNIESVAVKDLATLSSIVFALSKDFQELKLTKNIPELGNEVSALKHLVKKINDQVMELKNVFKPHNNEEIKPGGDNLQTTDSNSLNVRPAFGDLPLLKRRLNRTLANQYNVVHDIAALTNLVANLNNDVQHLKNVFTFREQQSKVKHDSNDKMKDDHERLERDVTVLMRKCDVIERELNSVKPAMERTSYDLSKEVRILKSNVNATRVHQVSISPTKISKKLDCFTLMK